MKKKTGMLILWVALSSLTTVLIVFFQKNNCLLGTFFSGSLITIFIEKTWHAVEDVVDTTDWKTSQRKLKRGHFIKSDTIIRISFAYLYRINIEGKCLLVPNSRNTGKYQPVGGVYKLLENEKLELKNTCHIMDDDKIPIDKSSRDDYRLRMESRYLRKFVKRFNSKRASRERIDNVSREFKEELIENGILNWDKISYRYCGRYITDLRFEEHFQIYEMLLFDIVELLPTQQQEQDLKKLIGKKNKLYCFATANQITSLGIDVSSGKLNEWIGDQTPITLQENETKLMKIEGVGKTFSVEI